MIVVNPTETRHNISLIPRYYTTDAFVLELKNESTNVLSTINIVLSGSSFTNNFSISDGYLFLKFDADFLENDKFRITLKQGDEIMYRGKIKATSQEPQDYKQTKDKYYYE